MSSIVPSIGYLADDSSIVGKQSNNDNTTSRFKNVLAEGQNYQVSRMEIPARCHLPLQSDLHQSKHITVLSGIIHLTLSDDVMILVADESIYIAQGALHGLENRADSSATIVSVDYCG